MKRRRAMLALLLAACSDRAVGPVLPPPPARAPDPAAARSPHPGPGALAIPAAPAASRPGPTTRAEARTRAQSALDPAQKRALRAAVREGRAAAQASDWLLALAAFERALAIDPSSTAVLCEGGFVAYRAGRLDDAARMLDRARAQLPGAASVPEKERVPTAMCLYNVGLVREARGNRSGALSEYRASLGLRPNATVEARARALEATAPTAPTASASPQTFEDVAAQARNLACQEIDPEATGACRRGAPQEEGESIVAEDRRLASTDGAVEAHLYEVTATGVGETHLAVLAVRSPSGSFASLAAGAYSPGAFGISSELDVVRFALEDLAPGGLPEVVLELTRWTNDEDMGVCETSGDNEHMLFVCSADAGLECMALPIERWTDWERYSGCEAEGEIGNPGEAPTLERTHEGFELDLVLAGGIATARVKEGRLPPELRGLAGRHPVRALFGNPALRWIEEL